MMFDYGRGNILWTTPNLSFFVCQQTTYIYILPQVNFHIDKMNNYSQNLSYYYYYYYFIINIDVFIPTSKSEITHILAYNGYDDFQ
jgi:hypothetical protein